MIVPRQRSCGASLRGKESYNSSYLESYETEGFKVIGNGHDSCFSRYDDVRRIEKLFLTASATYDDVEYYL